MLMRFIWKPETLVNMAARRVSPVALSRTLGGMVGNVWKCSGRPTSFTACQSGSHDGCHIGSMSHEHDSSRPRSPIFATRWISRTAAPTSPWGRQASPIWRAG
jgi:hypothetical protein